MVVDDKDATAPQLGVVLGRPQYHQDDAPLLGRQYRPVECVERGHDQLVSLHLDVCPVDAADEQHAQAEDQQHVAWQPDAEQLDVHDKGGRARRADQLRGSVWVEQRLDAPEELQLLLVQFKDAMQSLSVVSVFQIPLCLHALHENLHHAAIVKDQDVEEVREGDDVGPRVDVLKALVGQHYFEVGRHPLIQPGYV